MGGQRDDVVVLGEIEVRLLSQVIDGMNALVIKKIIFERMKKPLNHRI